MSGGGDNGGVANTLLVINNRPETFSIPFKGHGNVEIKGHEIKVIPAGLEPVLRQIGIEILTPERALEIGRKEGSAEVRERMVRRLWGVFGFQSESEADDLRDMIEDRVPFEEWRASLDYVCGNSQDADAIREALGGGEPGESLPDLARRVIRERETRADEIDVACRDAQALADRIIKIVLRETDPAEKGGGS